MNKSLSAVCWGTVAAAALDLLARWVLWPRLLGAGGLDLSLPNIRILFTLTGAVPIVVGGLVAGRLAPRTPVVHGIIVGAVMLIPMLLELPKVLLAYTAVPQSAIPLFVAMVLRPLGGAAGGYLSGRVPATLPR